MQGPRDNWVNARIGPARQRHRSICNQSIGQCGSGYSRTSTNFLPSHFNIPKDACTIKSCFHIRILNQEKLYEDLPVVTFNTA